MSNDHHKNGHPNLRTVVRSSAVGSGRIDFSIVIATFNRPAQLTECLQAISQLSYPRERYEVVVVDDGGDRDLAPAIRPLLERVNIAVLKQPNSGPAKARNLGILAARGDYTVFTDDDCRPDSLWLDAIARAIERNPECAVGGETINGLTSNVFSTASQVLIHFLNGYFNRDAENALFMTSNNLAFPRARFLEFGGFDVRFPRAAAEDWEACDRWRWHGGRIVSAPDAVVRHYHAMDAMSFLRQHLNYGRGAVMLRKLRRQRWGRVPWEGPLFYVKMLNYPFLHCMDHRPAAVALLMGISQLMMPLGYMSELCAGRSAGGADAAR